MPQIAIPDDAPPVLRASAGWPALAARAELDYFIAEHALALLLHGKTCGIVGLGVIGRQFARVAAGIGMRFIASRQLALMKPTAILINTARGAIVDEPALIDALAAGRIAGAGLDVFSTEPLPPGHPLASLPNVVLTPHCAGVTPEALGAGLRMAVENIWEFFAGRPAHVVIA
jgi:phosphoglycerate dehydrogenase-like enzyme